jgi:exodeoxyribonuclease V alpha subunit
VSEWNRLGEQWLLEVAGEGAPSSEWYAGRPLLITRNDARLGLSNGDTGVVVRIQDRLVAVFPGPPEEGPRRFDPVQLESVETAYAMTVHKSQGSEYPSVVLILPPTTSPLVGRELVYTGITRTKAHLLVVGSTQAMRRSVESPARRMTGLAGALS